ncbi:hypothetical protein KIL84_014264 [Mauremys mutica]|uniref:Uncharacterized protein n=1 Tax=Mauremys mutica TaxID=74926 RepID=A0A9D3XPE2_9SAUR|nr:hypothetical protein KIL84_014264 [Mauremys mutica]
METRRARVNVNAQHPDGWSLCATIKGPNPDSREGQRESFCWPVLGAGLGPRRRECLNHLTSESKWLASRHCQCHSLTTLHGRRGKWECISRCLDNVPPAGRGKRGGTRDEQQTLLV